jgi:hypothetical protein
MFQLKRIVARFVHRSPANRRCRPVLETLEDRTVPTLLGQSLFPADNPWNQQITNAPVAANSAAVMNNIIGTYGNGAFHPDFGQDYHTSQDLYGIPINIVHGNSAAKVTFVLDDYASESDPVPVPLPANPVLEGDYQNGPKFGLAARGDSHLIVWDVDNNVAYEFYAASRPNENADGHWHALQESVWDMKTNTFRTIGWTSADAAGLSVLAGLVRPDEALPANLGGQGAITHAIRMTLQNAVLLNQFIYPASHIANSGSNAAIQPPMGARFRLKAGVDISQLNPEAKIVAQALKDYGMIVADNGSNFYLSGASYSVDGNNQYTMTWNDNDIQDSVHGLKSLHFSDFELVDLTPVVTGLNVSHGPSGTAVTITGLNFSGAAGHLQVFFGSTPATSVTVVDDAHVIAVAPAGSGTVDVRVQSGVTTASDPENIKNPIFGYGTSAVVAADLFTIDAGTVQPAASIVVSPATTTVAAGTRLPFKATALDASGHALAAQPAFTWRLTGLGSLSATGLYTAPAQAGGSYTVTASVGSVQGSATVTVTPWTGFAIGSESVVRRRIEALKAKLAALPPAPVVPGAGNEEHLHDMPRGGETSTPAATNLSPNVGSVDPAPVSLPGQVVQPVTDVVDGDEGPELDFRPTQAIDGLSEMMKHETPDSE